jgi:hypothetical protein
MDLSHGANTPLRFAPGNLSSQFKIVSHGDLQGVAASAQIFYLRNELGAKRKNAGMGNPASATSCVTSGPPSGIRFV